MASKTQNESFINALISTDLLDQAIDWVKDNLEPADVYGDDVIVGLNQKYDPQDIFTKDQLESWAEDNGYEKP